MYKYQEHRDFVLTPDGQRAMIRVVRIFYKEVFRGVNAITLEHALEYHCTWDHMAIIDYLTELRVITEVRTVAGTPTQRRRYRLV